MFCVGKGILLMFVARVMMATIIMISAGVARLPWHREATALTTSAEEEGDISG
jgi:hypothetical protein